MPVLNEYADESDKKFYESVGLLVTSKITAEKAAEISGYSFNTYMELIKRQNIYPYIYDREAFEMDLESIDDIMGDTISE